MDCRKLQILYVEDEEAILDSVKALLSRRFEKVYIAKNGEDGLKLYEEHRPDVVVTDVVMPKMNGIKMVDRIKTSKEAMPVVIIVTAYRGEEYHCELANEHILKPFNPAALVEAIIEHSKCEGLI